MSYANHYILSTISQLQPDKKTIFAYDIKMEEMQKLTQSLKEYDTEQMIIFDKEGTIIGSSCETYLGGSFSDTSEETKEQADEAFYTFRKEIAPGLFKLQNAPRQTAFFTFQNAPYCGYLSEGSEYSLQVHSRSTAAAKYFQFCYLWYGALLAIRKLL